jgi:hypothetical protein
MPKPARTHYINNFLYANSIHIIAGQSGAGKTTWLLQMIEYWQRLGPAPPGLENFELGEQAPWLFITADRTASSMQDLHYQMECKLDFARFHSWANLRRDGKWWDYSPDKLIQLCRSNLPKGGVAFIDCAHLLMGKLEHTKARDVRDFCATLQRELIIESGITPFLTAYTAKQRSDSVYTGRDRLSGVVTWQGMSDSICVFQANEKYRNIVEADIYLRYAPSTRFFMSWNDQHRMIHAELPTEKQDIEDMQRELSEQTELYNWVEQMPADTELSKDTLRSFFLRMYASARNPR